MLFSDNSSGFGFDKIINSEREIVVKNFKASSMDKPFYYKLHCLKFE